MPTPRTDLSLTELALLTAIVDLTEADTQALREFVPHPFDPECEWIDELQSLLNRGFVIRVIGNGRYLYRATLIGQTVMSAFIHPDAVRQARRGVTAG